MKLRSKIALKVILSLLYVLLIVITIISIAQSGFAHSANGMKIPDTWLYIPLGVFLIVTVIQALLFHMAKEKYGIPGLCLSLIKLISVYLVDLYNDYYVFNFAYVTGGNGAGFHANIWNTILIAMFLGVTLIIAIIEMIGSIRMIKSTSKKS